MNFKITQEKIGEVDGDVLVVEHFSDAKGFIGSLAAVDELLHGYLKLVLQDEQFEATPGKTLLVHTHDKIKATRVLILGLGKKQEVNAEVRRRAYAAAAKIAQAVKAKKIIIPTSANWPTQAVVEGLLLGSYQFLKYRSKEDQAKKRNTLKQVLFLVEKKSAPDRLQQEVKRGQLYAQGTIFARDLVNEPAVHLTPKTFAKYARA